MYLRSRIGMKDYGQLSKFLWDLHDELSNQYGGLCCTNRPVQRSSLVGAGQTDGMSAPAKPKYQTTNWKDYNTALKAHGSLLIWLDEAMCWQGSASGKRGRRPKYSEAAIQFCLTIKGLFNLALRQAMAWRKVCLSSLTWTGRCLTSVPLSNFSR